MTNNAYPQGDLDQLIPEAQAADFLTLNIRTLQKWRTIGIGPRFVRVSSRCVRYRRRDLIAWSEANLTPPNAA